ncbi:MAG: YerC/YecD family TrpR-related protein [Candidatus Peregrinibacteria bacterium]|nr:YerC/YecD family TrpR-related protein [Candidatus Peregrinibacteria bacterium]
MKRRFTEDSWRKEPWFRGLVNAFTSCSTAEDTANFLRDIATLSELKALSERLEVARLLAKGLSYRKVAELTGASTTTVTRVARFIENGEGGYRKVLNVHRHHRSVAKKPLDTPMEASQQREAKQEIASSVLQKYLAKRGNTPQ